MAAGLERVAGGPLDDILSQPDKLATMLLAADDGQACLRSAIVSGNVELANRLAGACVHWMQSESSMLLALQSLPGLLQVYLKHVALQDKGVVESLEDDLLHMYNLIASESLPGEPLNFSIAVPSPDSATIYSQGQGRGASAQITPASLHQLSNAAKSKEPELASVDRVIAQNRMHIVAVLVRYLNQSLHLVSRGALEEYYGIIAHIAQCSTPRMMLSEEVALAFLCAIHHGIFSSHTAIASSARAALSALQGRCIWQLWPTAILTAMSIEGLQTDTSVLERVRPGWTPATIIGLAQSRGANEPQAPPSPVPAPLAAAGAGGKLEALAKPTDSEAGEISEGKDEEAGEDDADENGDGDGDGDEDGENGEARRLDGIDIRVADDDDSVSASSSSQAAPADKAKSAASLVSAAESPERPPPHPVTARLSSSGSGMLPGSVASPSKVETIV